MAKSKRIEFLAELTKDYHHVLDIGTDHGLVLRIAFEKGYIEKAIASDLREKPLKQAEKNLKNYPVSLIKTDGFLNVKETFDLAIIAGMGSYLICDILDNAPKHDTTYLLQPNDKIDILRTYLMKHHFKIVDEYLVFDKFYYVIIKAIRGKMELSESDLYLGPILKTKPESKAYYQHKIKQIEKIIIKADLKRKEELENLLNIYKLG
ncbi:MAG: class I SAM-dependent methyltransferase [Tenericutes bacterium]|nr:class I SAM-dependent methyltransferase [Mycoplasmatota bacterium]